MIVFTKKTVFSTTIKKAAFFLLAFMLFSLQGVSYSEEKTIAVIVSKKIKPYMQVLKGIEKGIDKNISHDMDIFFLSPKNNQQDKIKSTLLKKEYDLFLAIGPEASTLIWSMNTTDTQGKIFSAVLDPHQIISSRNPACGVSLKIPVNTQLKEINSALPGIKNIGLLFDQKYNHTFFKKAVLSSKDNGLTVIPLGVSSKKDIPRILKENLNRIDCVWMIPDQTVISEKIVQYVIKQSLYQKKGVIGYNSFFIRSGAVFAFKFDYSKIGNQTAGRVNAYFKEGQCTPVVPIFDKTINVKIARTLGMQARGGE